MSEQAERKNRIKAVTKEANDVLARVRTTEYENWIVRIVFGGGGLKVRSVPKAITKQHVTFTGHELDPSHWVHHALWTPTSKLICGGGGGKPSAKSGSGGAASRVEEEPAAKRCKKVSG